MGAGGTRILFLSGSVGLGHATRDVAIAREIRRLLPEAVIEWIAASPAKEYLAAEGEQLLPESERFADVTTVADSQTHESAFNVGLFALSVRGQWEENAHLYAELVGGGAYDLAIGDETYEVTIALKQRPELRRTPFVSLYDFIGIDRMGHDPREALAVFMFNRIWARPPQGYTPVFLGELADVPDRPFGPFMPNRRAFVAEHYHVAGYVLQFDPAEYRDRGALRRRLGYGDSPLIVATVGGTGQGSALVDLCVRAFSRVRDAVPGAEMLLVGGPRVDAAGRPLPDGVSARGFVPRLYEHLAACDLAVTQAGGTTTLELTALGRPFIYFPIEGHCEQMGPVSDRLRRHGAGVRMSYRDTTPAQLADRIVEGLASVPAVPNVPFDGARRVAEIAVEALRAARSGAAATAPA